jgi:hypothetical protein
MKNDYKKIFNKIHNPALQQLISDREEKEENENWLMGQSSTSPYTFADFNIEHNEQSIGTLYNKDSKDYQVYSANVDSNAAMERITRRYLESDEIETNKDRIKLALIKYEENMKKKFQCANNIKTWITNLITSLFSIASIFLIIFSSDYKQSTLLSTTINPSQWEIIFMFIIILYIIYSAIIFIGIIVWIIKYFIIKKSSADDFITDLIEK